MARRGMTTGMIVTLVMMVVVLIIFVLFIINTTTDIKAKTARDICKASVRANAALRIGTQEFSSKLECFTEERTIDVRAPEETKRQLAKALTDCADQFWQGKLELFSEDGVFCHICSIISFSDKGKTIDGFKQFLFTTPMSGTTTYAQFLSGYQSANAGVIGTQQQVFQQDTLDTSKQYAPVFVYIRGRDKIEHYMQKVGGYTAGTGILLIGVGLIVKGGVTFVVSWWTGAGAVAGAVMTISGVVVAGVGLAIDAWTYLFGGAPTEWMAMTQFVQYQPEALKALGCEMKVPAERKDTFK